MPAIRPADMQTTPDTALLARLDPHEQEEVVDGFIYLRREGYYESTLSECLAMGMVLRLDNDVRRARAIVRRRVEE